MARWFRTLDISDLWIASSLRDGDLSPQAIAKGIAERLERIPGDDGLEDIKEEFIGLSEDANADFNDLNSVYAGLCDWGDQDHRLWVKTI